MLELAAVRRLPRPVRVREVDHEGQRAGAHAVVVHDEVPGVLVDDRRHVHAARQGPAFLR